MAGKEFTGKDKTVQKMTRDGLTEENLHDGSVKNISKLDREGRPSKSFEMSLDHRHVNTASEDSAGKRNKKYRDKSGLAAEERIRSRDGKCTSCGKYGVSLNPFSNKLGTCKHCGNDLES